MLFNPIISLIHNLKTDRYHPVIFEEKPLPGGPDSGAPVRHKSKGHHTEGFDTRELALAHIENELKVKIPEARVVTDGGDFPWDGEDIPAMVHFFNLGPVEA
jgi:hypothetical protein